MEGALMPGVYHRRVSTRVPSLILFALLLICYGYFFPRWADWNQNSRFDLVLAAVDEGTLAIDSYVANTGDYAYYRGHYYSDKAPGMALLGIPVYSAYKMLPAGVTGRVAAMAEDSPALEATARRGGAGLTAENIRFFLALTFTTFVTVVVPSAVLGVLLFRLALHFGCTVREALVSTLLYALGTGAFPYSNSFVGHQPAAFLLLAAFALLASLRWRQSEGLGPSAAGFLLGSAAVVEYQTVLVGGVLALYAVAILGRPAAILAQMLLGALPPLAALVAYDYLAFGTPLPVGYAHSALWTEVHGTGFFSLTYPHVDALWGITFGVHRGLFFLSPFLLFALPGYLVLWRDGKHRSEFWVLALAPILFLLFNGSSAMWQGGFSIGPRYLLPALPFLALPAGLGTAWAWRHWYLKPLAGIAVAWSLFAVWAESIGGQSFPDYTPNPLFDLSIPRLLDGDVARNLGTALGLSGWISLLPLVVALAAGTALLLWPSRSISTRDAGKSRLPGRVRLAGR